MRTPSSNRRLVPIALYGAAAVVTTLSFAVMSSQGLVNAMVDSQSHLLQALQIAWSLTPGVSQIGFWPPLLRVLLLPAVILLPSALVLQLGAFSTMLPIMLLGAFFLYNIARMSGVSPKLSVLAPALFVMHPVVEYFSSSAMTEVPLMVSLFGATYYALRWSRSLGLLDLSMLAAFVSFTTLSRYEGFLVVPLSVLFVVCRCLAEKMTFQKMKAIVVMFSFLAVLGLLLIMVYSTVYAGTPFSFLSLGVELSTDAANVGFVKQSVSFAKVVKSVHMFYRASLHMHGAWFVWCFPAAALLVLALRRKWQDLFVIAFLLSPGIFVIAMLALGRNSISVPELPKWGWNTDRPYEKFLNVRYALTWVGAGIVALTLCLDALSKTRYLKRITLFLLLPAALAASGWWFAQAWYVRDFSFVKNESTLRLDDAATVFDKYDGGRILFVRFYNERSMLLSGIPMDRFVNEANYLYFPQALQEPWLFVRWVAVRHSSSDIASVSRFKLITQLVEKERTEEFQYYYELVDQDDYIRMYRLRENVLRDQAVALGYDPEKIPSLNPDAPWKPKTFYQDILSR